ncbi:MAG: hypothetical protein LUQ65_12280, partial [Candidatus Helarchaeota archaeon]|nr:hypothetical protein [Candidatus Helarchaeota archaeon]
MKRNYLTAISLLVFLLVLTALSPAVVNGWSNPLATDPTGGESYIGEDIHSVDAQLTTGFVYFR